MSNGIYCPAADAADVKYLKGVGPAKAALLAKIGVRTVGDLLALFPRDYVDFSRGGSFAAAADGEIGSVFAAVSSPVMTVPTRNRAVRLFRVRVTDDNGAVGTVLFFNAEYAAASLKEGQRYCFIGKIDRSAGRVEISSPKFQAVGEDAAPLSPVYPLTQGLTNSALTKIISAALDRFLEAVTEPLPDALRHEYGLCTLNFAVKNIHFPHDEQSLALARQRLAFGELLTFTLAMQQVKNRAKAADTRPIPACDLSPFYAALPFTFTDAQQNAVSEIVSDLQKPHPMSRLLQGDVGSGKTAVCAAACYLALRAGRQAALMAPTELLANQHYESLKTLLPGEADRIGLLTGSTRPSERKKLLAALACGEIGLLIGTHALFSEDVIYSDLALVVTDEQHRFGVNQRACLTGKGDQPHLLVMSATPIPRTLALTLYGDLDVSVLDVLPKGRKPIKTYLYRESTREHLFAFLKKELDKGHQAYIVCPAIDENENERAAVTEYYTEVERAFAGYRTAMLYGKMPSDQKNDVHARFAAGDIQLLVSTTVIEVGIDVPNATVMVVEDADCFGLAQLHQLRGRVGRGSAEAFCVLATRAVSAAAIARLKILTANRDGFVIADEDLKLRGPGDFLGKRQSGVFSFRMASALSDSALVVAARNAAERLFAAVPPLIEAEIGQIFGEIGSSLN